MSDDILYKIAEFAGLARGFQSAHGAHVETPVESIAAVLTSLGYDVSSTAARETTFEQLSTTAKAIIDPTIVLSAGRQALIPVDAKDGEIIWRLTLEDGTSSEGRAAA